MLQRTCHREPAAGDRRRPPWTLLVESGEPGIEISDFGAFRDNGFSVAACAGPGVDAAECPVVRGEHCALLDDADVVLFDLGGDRPRRSAVLHALRVARPDVAVVVRSAKPAPPAARGCTAIPATTSVNGQVSALQKAVLRCPARRS